MRPRVWRWLLPAAGTPLMLSPLPCVSRVLLLSRVKPRVPDPDVPDVWFFVLFSGLRLEQRASMSRPPVTQRLLLCPWQWVSLARAGVGWGGLQGRKAPSDLGVLLNHVSMGRQRLSSRAVAIHRVSASTFRPSLLEMTGRLQFALQGQGTMQNAPPPPASHTHRRRNNIPSVQEIPTTLPLRAPLKGVSQEGPAI